MNCSNVVSHNNIIHYYGGGTVSSPNLIDKKVEMGVVEHNVSYFNNLSVPVTISLRSGLKTTFLPTRCLNNRSFIVRIQTVLLAGAKESTLTCLHDVNEDSDLSLQLLKSSYIQNPRPAPHGTTRVSVDYEISFETLKNNSGTIYYNEVDVVISLLTVENVPDHPFSSKGMKTAALHKGNCANEGFNYNIRILDNTNALGDMYKAIGDTVYRVTPIRDSKEENGIYITSNGNVDSTNSVIETSVTQSQLDDYEKAGLYKTFAEAKANGNVDLLRKLEVVELEHATLLNKRKLDESKTKADLELLLKEKELKDITKVMEMNKVLRDEITADRIRRDEEESLARKRRYENLSYDRKDTSEMIKFVPAVLIGVATVIGIIIKFKK